MGNDNKEFRAKDLRELIPGQFKDLSDFKKKMHEKCVNESIKNVKKGITKEDLLSIYVNYLDIIDELINSYYERVSEHFTIYYPEASIKLSMLEDFLKITDLQRDKIARQFSMNKESMGLDLSSDELKVLEMSINGLKSMMEQKRIFEEKAKALALQIAKATSGLVGELIAAKLLAAAGSLKRLMLMPSSTIQVLGAEKALFRHLRSNAKPPKHGIIFNTSFVGSAPLKHRGKIARALASKIVIAVKMDYFKGKDNSKELIEDMNKKIRGLSK